MSWASRRRALYVFGVAIFFGVFVGIPVLVLTHRAPTCDDGIQNQGETAIDKGGPCPILDERYLSPVSVLWARSFEARAPQNSASSTTALAPGLYDAVAYIQNPNEDAGVANVRYRFGLYDNDNVLVAERFGSTFIMPGGITPVFEGGINTGNRGVAHTYFSFVEPPVWERFTNAAASLSISNKDISYDGQLPRLSAVVANTSVAPAIHPRFVAIIFDPAGNALAASATILDRLEPGAEANLAFTWPERFRSAVGRIDVFPFLAPLPPR